ncbi:hypothetical protein JZ751_025503 [Albula glossodonta]|uniref:Uncharacterized protein n=1 Tax=Albula glossodonta TaxID=121402 RepID=A0A8T2NE82_9TELE|nr:hypothetical protein JZ751_025503 [Albula glossodonta]
MYASAEGTSLGETVSFIIPVGVSGEASGNAATDLASRGMMGVKPGRTGHLERRELGVRWLYQSAAAVGKEAGESEVSHANSSPPEASQMQIRVTVADRLAG